MPNLDVCTLGASHVDSSTGAVLVQCTVDDKGEESFGEIPLYQCLGVTSVPYAPDDNGAAEGVVVESVAGLPGVVIGGRDARTAKIAGNAAPGDTILHTTGPNQAAQVQLKEKKRQAVLCTRGTDDKQILLSLDGNKDKVTLAAFGYVVEVSRDNGFNVCSPNGETGISVTDQGGHLRGKWVLGGKIPIPGLAPMIGPMAGQVPPAVAPLIAAKGVTFGQ